MLRFAEGMYGLVAHITKLVMGNGNNDDRVIGARFSHVYEFDAVFRLRPSRMYPRVVNTNVAMIFVEPIDDVDNTRVA